jgi:hypothetical protein
VADLKRVLSESTGQPWQVSLHSEGGQMTLQEKFKEEKAQLVTMYQKDPWVQEVLTTFPGSVIESVEMIKESE